MLEQQTSSLLPYQMIELQKLHYLTSTSEQLLPNQSSQIGLPASQNAYVGTIGKIDWSAIYDGKDNLDAESEKYCSTDACEIKLY